MPPILQLRGLTKDFRRHRVLADLNLQVGRGEIVGLLGPNGCGKTTTLRIAAGYLWPDRGRVQINGRDLTPANADGRSQVGYLPERAPVYDAFRVERYLRFVAAAKGIIGANRAHEVSRALEVCNLTAVRQRIIGQLSKGYRQRIGLAQALLGGPDLLLLDEPTNGLDPFQIIEARQFIRAAAEDRAVLFSTHIMQEVEALCTRVVYLRDGALIELDQRSNETSSCLIEVSESDRDALLAVIARFASMADSPPVVSLADGGVRLEIPIETEQAGALASAVAANCQLRQFTLSSQSLEQRLVHAIRSTASEATP